MNRKKQSEMETFFLALSDNTRLRLLNLMREGEICVWYLTEVLNESQPKISRHLACLRSASIVEARRDGKWIHYKITAPKDDFAAQFLQNTLTWMSTQEEMQSEYKKLEELCSSSNNKSKLCHAPKPNTFAKTNMSKHQNRELDTFLL